MMRLLQHELGFAGVLIVISIFNCLLFVLKLLEISTPLFVVNFHNSLFALFRTFVTVIQINCTFTPPVLVAFQLWRNAARHFT